MISDDDDDDLGATPPMYGRCHDGPMMYIIYDGVSRPVHCSAATDETMTYSRTFFGHNIDWYDIGRRRGIVGPIYIS